MPDARVLYRGSEACLDRDQRSAKVEILYSVACRRRRDGDEPSDCALLCCAVRGEATKGNYCMMARVTVT